MKNLLSLIFVVLLVFCCDRKDCCGPQYNNELIGSWQLYEYGYSPGSEYIVEQVPAEPAQTITFKSDGRFSSTSDGLDQFNYYLVMEEFGVLALFEDDPGNETQDVSKLKNAYDMRFENGLKLSYRWCIEGCHLGFRRM